ncbi:MAG TPA: LPS export ABC transporter periplasmic protein LptC [Acidiferrobacter sp.]|nr:LPS export ABC transporter periplasmic protein LptC [Acidiferrobacter sp.]
MGWWLSRFLLVAGLLLFSGLFWWLPRALVRPALDLATTQPAQPDYYIGGLRLTAMNRYGHPQFVLTATRLVHFPYGKRTLLIAPRLTQFGQRAVTTTTAKRGFISPHGHTLIMRGKVRVFRGPTAQIGAATVHTQTLTVHLAS